ncbi:MAG: enoyl-CoA hydratase-related protein, partial [Candidatus Adiutricales bacterium]
GLGMIPAAGGTQTVPRIAGLGKALDMLLTNRWIDANEALETGLINKVVTPDQLMPEAEEMAHKIASHKPRVIRSAKQAVMRGLDLPLDQGLELEKRIALNLA